MICDTLCLQSSLYIFKELNFFYYKVTFTVFQLREITYQMHIRLFVVTVTLNMSA